MKRIIAWLMGASLAAVGMVMLTSVAAQAHNPSHQADCQAVSISGTDYNGSNSWYVKMDGNVVAHGTFGSTLRASTTAQTPPQDGSTHVWVTHITAHDDPNNHSGFSPTYTNTVGPCGQAPLPRDASAALTVKPPTCNKPGFATITSETNSARIGHVVNETVGTHTQQFHALPGHLFSDGSTDLFLPYRILGPTGHCPRPPAPPVHHKVKYPHAHVRVSVTDKCNCFMDKVVMHHGSHVRVVKRHPNRLTWTFKVTGKRIGNRQYLLPSRIGGQHGWAKVQHYIVHTTNVPCPCHKTHTCPHNGPPHHHCAVEACGVGRKETD